MSIGLDNVRSDPFLLNKKTGEISLNFDPQKDMKGYFEFDVLGNDTDGYSDTAKVNVRIFSVSLSSFSLSLLYLSLSSLSGCLLEKSSLPLFLFLFFLTNHSQNIPVERFEELLSDLRVIIRLLLFGVFNNINQEVFTNCFLPLLFLSSFLGKMEENITIKQVSPSRVTILT